MSRYPDNVLKPYEIYCRERHPSADWASCTRINEYDADGQLVGPHEGPHRSFVHSISEPEEWE